VRGTRCNRGDEIDRPRIEAAGFPQRRRERRSGIASPVGEQDEQEIVCATQTWCDAGVQERALADAALAEEEREPRGEQVRDDELRVGIAPEEVRRILLLVARQAFVRGLRRPRRDLRHVSARSVSSVPSAASSAPT
jgi:hypothetical protein